MVHGLNLVAVGLVDYVAQQLLEAGVLDVLRLYAVGLACDGIGKVVPVDVASMHAACGCCPRQGGAARGLVDGEHHVGGWQRGVVAHEHGDFSFGRLPLGIAYHHADDSLAALALVGEGYLLSGLCRTALHRLVVDVDHIAELACER